MLGQVFLTYLEGPDFELFAKFGIVVEGNPNDAVWPCEIKDLIPPISGSVLDLIPEANDITSLA